MILERPLSPLLVWITSNFQAITAVGGPSPDEANDGQIDVEVEVHVGHLAGGVSWTDPSSFARKTGFYEGV